MNARILSLGLGLLLALTLPPLSANAETLTASNKIYIRAVVPPARLVVLNHHGRIRQIISNTDAPVVPQVFLGTISENNRVELSAAVYEEYQQLMQTSPHKTGVIYQRAAAPSEFSLKITP